jgi:hypothetical protein
MHAVGFLPFLILHFAVARRIYHRHQPSQIISAAKDDRSYA